ncbi:hypothetical protein CLPUN_29260 [Clostridium puniceum]|uniref:Uncharacterized protein n=1 Tax=Clostridium puniceum TaxID=29367 RepID=A0A1S8TE43_9CLOT|nr:hypothetical protein CLPUN_29260 [Clostridium puniceum]
MILTKVTERIYYLINEKETDRPVPRYIKLLLLLNGEF